MLFEPKRLFKQIIAVGAATFAAAWPSGLAADLAQGKAAIYAGVAAAIAAGLAAAGNLVKQLFDKAHGYFPADPQALVLLGEAKAKIDEARKALGV